MKQSYIIHRKITKVYGHQTHVVDAESYVDAVKLAKLGKANLDDENIDVSELSDICEVYLPDDKNPTVLDMRDVEIVESNTPISRQPPFPQSPSQPSIDVGGQGITTLSP